MQDKFERDRWDQFDRIFRLLSLPTQTSAKGIAAENYHTYEAFKNVLLAMNEDKNLKMEKLLEESEKLGNK